MGDSSFFGWLVKVTMGWAKWLSNIVWQSLGSGYSSNSFLHWFGQAWPYIAVVMLILGVIVDWAVWMIRWRPYWLWFRKKQILYAEDGEMPLAEKQALMARRKAEARERMMREKEQREAEAQAAEPAEVSGIAEEEDDEEELDIFAPKKKKSAPQDSETETDDEEDDDPFRAPRKPLRVMFDDPFAENEEGSKE